MVAEQVPSKLVAGDSFAWERDLADYPADIWELTYLFSNADAEFTITATADGTTHVASALPATTEDYVAGRYRWHGRVTDDTDIYTVEDGWLVIDPDPSDKKVDWRSHARKMLDAIEAALEGKANKNQLDLVSYSIGGELSLTRDRDQLLKLRAKYTQELADEEGIDRINDRNVYIRFGTK